MSVSAVSAASVAPVSPERAAGPGPDRDGGSDAAAVKAPVQAAPSPGTGKIVDITV